jgi:acetyltransferase-like isoleucine patch superfamily enzyme
MLRYRKKVFLTKIESKEKSLVILGSVSIRGCKKIKIGKNVTIYPNVSFSGEGEVIIGDNVQIGEGTLIYSHKKIHIGNNVAIAGQCYIIDCNHGVDKNSKIQDQPLEFDEDGIFIGNDVWVASGAKIIRGSKINDGVVIGAMSVVNSVIDKYGIAVGIPAKIIKFRT